MVFCIFVKGKSMWFEFEYEKVSDLKLLWRIEVIGGIIGII